MWLCPPNTCLNREGKGNCNKSSWAASKGKKLPKPNQTDLEEKTQRNLYLQNSYYTGKDLAPDRNPFYNLKNVAHYCNCCSLFFMACYILEPLVCENKQEKTLLSPQAKKHQVNALNQQRFLTQPVAEFTGFPAAEQTSRLFAQTQRLSCIGILFIFSSCSPYLGSL